MWCLVVVNEQVVVVLSLLAVWKAVASQGSSRGCTGSCVSVVRWERLLAEKTGRLNSRIVANAKSGSCWPR